MKTAYDFYRLPENERIALIGTEFKVQDKYDKGEYFVIGLTEEGGWQNYGRQQGLIWLSLPMNYKGKTWFRVAAFSPDDLDMDLDFDDPAPDLRDKICNLLREMPKDNVTYREVLEFIQSFYGGEIDG